MWTIEHQRIIDSLIAAGEKKLQERAKDVKFTDDEEANKLLSKLDVYPRLFVFGCLMDRQIDFNQAWNIPIRIGKRIGGFEFSTFRTASFLKIKKIFREEKLHRFRDEKMPKVIYEAIQRIASQYDGNAAKIWEGRPNSATVVRRFLEFDGAGVKIATMAANILVRDFKIPMQDLSGIDISPDSRVKRYFIEHGLLRRDAKIDELLYLAREIYPRYPGILDLKAFEEGAARNFQAKKLPNRPLSSRRPSSFETAAPRPPQDEDRD